jgi:hypothetical protein
MSAEEVLGQRTHNGGPVNRAQSFYMDHSAANFDDQFFVWRMSSSYTATDTALNYIGLSLSHIGGFTDPADVLVLFATLHCLDLPLPIQWISELELTPFILKLRTKTTVATMIKLLCKL